jgi:catechol 2,3-dioxygenase-like lactoylglutathione lyase family enzyme
MAITLDHTIVPAHDKVASAKFFAKIFGLTYDGPMGPFAPVQINETLTFDFDDRRQGFEVHHYAFHVGEEEFNAIFRAHHGGRPRLRQPAVDSGGHADSYSAGRAGCFLPRSR